MANLRIGSSLDSSGFRAGLQGMKTGVDDINKQFAGLSRQVGQIFTLGALVNAGNQVVALAGQIKDLADQTGLSTDQVQAFDYQLRMSGGDSEMLVQMMTKLRDAQGQVINGNKAAIDAFSALGISQQQVVASSPDELLEMVAKAMASAGMQGEAFSAGLDVLAAKTVPRAMEALKALAEQGFDGLGKSAKDAGQLMEDELIRRLEDAGDKMETLKRRVNVFFAELGNRAATGIQMAAAFAGARLGGATSDEAIAIAAEEGKVPDTAEQRRKAKKAAEEQRLKEAAAAADEAQEQADMDLAEQRAQRQKDKREKAKSAADKADKEERANLADMARRSEANQQAGERADEIREKAAQDRKKALESAGGSESVIADRLARIGGFSSDAASPAYRVAQRQLQALEEIKRINEQEREALGRLTVGYV